MARDRFVRAPRFLGSRRLHTTCLALVCLVGVVMNTGLLLVPEGDYRRTLIGFTPAICLISSRNRRSHLFSLIGKI